MGEIVQQIGKRKDEIDPVQRSLEKPDAFSKFASVGKPGAPTTSQKPTRIRTMNWKRGKGRPRIHPPDKRKVHFF